MTVNPVPRKNHKLLNGTACTEYEMLAERKRLLEKRKQAIEDEIEITQLQINVAEGNPGA